MSAPTADARGDTLDVGARALPLASNGAVHRLDGFSEVLTWLEVGDAAQARRAFLRALNCH